MVDANDGEGAMYLQYVWVDKFGQQDADNFTVKSSYFKDIVAPWLISNQVSLKATFRWKPLKKQKVLNMLTRLILKITRYSGTI